MSLHEKQYDQALIKELPPNAQDVAHVLFATHPLSWFYEQQKTPEIDTYVMRDKKVSDKLWPEIIRAATLAKFTYLQPNAGYSIDQLKFLVGEVCKLIDRPLPEHPLKETMAYCMSEHPHLGDWLKQIIFHYNQALAKAKGRK